MGTRRVFIKNAIGAGLGMAAGSNLGESLKDFGGLPQGDRASKPQAMLVSTTGPRAIHSGLNTMRHDGSAADAVLTTALSQIALCAGCWVSYAGRMTAMYFEAKSGKLHALNACFDAPRGEQDPLTIPPPATPSGRNVLVPGFMAGVEALHSRFGKKEFADLFAPAIEIAADGMPLSRQMATLIQQKSTVLTRLEHGRQVFQKSDGRLVSAGEHFHQPQLAETLTQVANHGAAHMYSGGWARRFIEMVQNLGGHISLPDLEKYQPTWSEPLTTQLSGGVTVSGLPFPNRGCPLALAALNLADHAGITGLGHYTHSVAALNRMLKIELAVRVANLKRGRSALSELLGTKQLALDDFADRQLGSQYWQTIESDHWEPLLDRLRGNPPKASEHSDAVVAVDPEGNVAALLHTINTAGWGQTGLFVDGVSIPDSGARQQTAVAAAGPGGRISDHGTPLIALRNGKPMLAGSATGSGNVNASWQNFVDVLMYQMTPQAAADSPNFYNHTFEQAALEVDFFNRAIAAGLPLKQKPQFHPGEMGYWNGIGIDPVNREMKAGKIRKLDGIALQF